MTDPQILFGFSYSYDEIENFFIKTPIHDIQIYDLRKVGIRQDKSAVYEAQLRKWYKNQPGDWFIINVLILTDEFRKINYVISDILAIKLLVPENVREYLANILV